MRAKRVTRDFVLLTIVALIVVTLFAIVGRVRAAYGAEDRATVSAAYFKQSVRGQVARFRDATVTIRRLERENRRLRVRYTRDLGYGIRLAHDLYGVPEGQMWNVTNCENPNRHPFAINRSSGASGWFQFLGSTWRNQGLPRFSPFDPVASSLATARIVVRDGSWRQWACSP